MTAKQTVHEVYMRTVGEACMKSNDFRNTCEIKNQFDN